MTKDPEFWEQVKEAIAPKANRVLATVAFIRTFGQTIRGSAIVGTALGTGFSAADFVNIDWVVVGYAAAAILATALISALDAAFGMLKGGLPEGYIRGAVKQLAVQRASQMNTGLQEAVVDAAAAVKASQNKDTK